MVQFAEKSMKYKSFEQKDLDIFQQLNHCNPCWIRIKAFNFLELVSISFATFRSPSWVLISGVEIVESKIAIVVVT